MGWFDEQIKLRKQNDDNVLFEAFAGIAAVAMGKKLSSAYETDQQKTESAISEILRFYHIKPVDIPSNITNVNEQLEYAMHPHGFMYRGVKLEKGWQKDAIGAMLGFRKSDGAAVALIPSGLAGYSYWDNEEDRFVKITRHNADEYEEAMAFYKPFPQRKMGLKELGAYLMKLVSASDYFFIAMFTLLATLLGMLSTRFTHLLVGKVAESNNSALLGAIMVFMVCAAVTSLIISMLKSLVDTRISMKLDLSVEAATMSRLLSLPASFFKNYSSGELASMTGQVRTLCSMLSSAVFTGGITSLFSIIYISQIFKYAPSLVVPSLLVLAATFVFSIIIALIQQRISSKEMHLRAKESGMVYAMITGIQKIKLAGAEKRAFARFATLYAERSGLIFNPPWLIEFSSVVTLLIASVGTVAMYYMAVRNGVTSADYFAFNSAYGMVSGAFTALVSIAITAANVAPVLEVTKPIMDAVPEVSESKSVVTSLSGGIELNNVSFKYTDSMPNVIDGLSLKIRPGQYVAIVGGTGCGKSTLMRLLLGFETPQKGAIYYDGKDLSTIDLKTLRRKIGVVMQNDKLMMGNIFENIVVSAPWLTLDDAWAAAEMSGIAEDIRSMPMGMHTIIAEGSGGISGGQKQRLMIARAVAPKPKILMLDEATSALDNITQKQVSDALAALKCTRIVIAHRLSTIKQCDRIIYLERGHIVEDGTYDELIARNGRFAELVERQRVDV